MFLASPSNDAERAALIGAGVSAGALNNMRFSFLEGEGYSGTLNDMVKAYLETTHSVPWHKAMRGLIDGTYTFTAP